MAAPIDIPVTPDGDACIQREHILRPLANAPRRIHQCRARRRLPFTKPLDSFKTLLVCVDINPEIIGKMINRTPNLVCAGNQGPMMLMEGTYHKFIIVTFRDLQAELNIGHIKDIILLFDSQSKVYPTTKNKVSEPLKTRDETYCTDDSTVMLCLELGIITSEPIGTSCNEDWLYQVRPFLVRMKENIRVTFASTT